MLHRPPAVQVHTMGSNHARMRSEAGARRRHNMPFHAGLLVPGESPDDAVADQNVIAHLQIPKLRRQLALGHQLDEELEEPFVWRRYNRIGPLYQFAV